jgi:hypothetical protein
MEAKKVRTCRRPLRMVHNGHSYFLSYIYDVFVWLCTSLDVHGMAWMDSFHAGATTAHRRTFSLTCTYR